MRGRAELAAGSDPLTRWCLLCASGHRDRGGPAFHPSPRDEQCPSSRGRSGGAARAPCAWCRPMGCRVSTRTGKQGCCQYPASCAQTVNPQAAGSLSGQLHVAHERATTGRGRDDLVCVWMRVSGGRAGSNEGCSDAADGSDERAKLRARRFAAAMCAHLLQRFSWQPQHAQPNRCERSAFANDVSDDEAHGGRLGGGARHPKFEQDT